MQNLIITVGLLAGCLLCAKEVSDGARTVHIFIIPPCVTSYFHIFRWETLFFLLRTSFSSINRSIGLEPTIGSSRLLCIELLTRHFVCFRMIQPQVKRETSHGKGTQPTGWTMNIVEEFLRRTTYGPNGVNDDAPCVP